ncbi:MAG: gamma-glutamyltransferase [Planctomycetes bacterium]|nr:gamma-glutamyltransferase [Planctomycetota bacterium]
MKLILLVMVLLLVSARVCGGGDRVFGLPLATRSPALAKNGMAATSQPLATDAALDILKAGGNAIDAAIAANACLGLMEPTGCGIGGDLFAIVWDAEESKLHGYNGSGRSPGGLTLEKLKEELSDRGLDEIPAHGTLPISVPGCVDGWISLHEKFGKLPLEKVLEPAIRHAREGFPVSQVIAYYWQASVRKLEPQPGFMETFTRDGRAPVEGELWKNPDLAQSYERIAKEGRAGFYKGEVAERMARFVQEHGGYLTVEDLASHRGEWVEPVSTNYRGVDVWQLPPNGQGLAVLQILNIMEGYPVRDWGFGSTELLHHFIEAKKQVFEDRARDYVDPDFHKVPIRDLISRERAALQRSAISSEKAARSIDTGRAQTRDGDTVYLSVADSDGNMISLIQSNYRGIGSGVCPPGLGFGLQDRGELFSLDKEHANVYEPGKRPFHTIIPGFAFRDGKPWLSFGVMGGATQPQAQAWVLLNMIDFDMNLQEAGDAPRVVHVGSSQPTGFVMKDGGEVAIESGVSADVIAELEKRGHVISKKRGLFGGYQAVMRDLKHGTWVGASESRKDGHAAGY